MHAPKIILTLLLKEELGQIGKWLEIEKDNLGVGGVTVVRSPLATSTLSTGGRGAIISAGLHFEAERGVGQGDVVSPSNWLAFYDILLEALDLHSRDSDSFYTSSHDGTSMPVPRAAFADDLFSLRGTFEGFQRDADIVSAFALFATMTISSHKLRATWVRNSVSHVAGRSEFVLHGKKWAPLPVSFCDRPFKHLGVLQSGRRGGDDTFAQVHRELQSICLRLGNLKLSPEATWDCLFKAVYPRILYTIRFMAWPLARYERLDRIVSKLLRRITLNGTSYPTALLYLPQSEGGLGFQSLSALAQERKMSLLLKLEWGSSLHRHTAASLLGRALRGLGSIPLRDTAALSEANIDRIWEQRIGGSQACWNGFS